MKKITLILFGIIVCLSCLKRKNDSQGVITISIDQSINKLTEGINCDNIVKNYRIIPLETSDSVLIGNGSIRHIYDDYIIITDNNTVYFFALPDGHFIHKFNRAGNGPGEYVYINSIAFDLDHKKIYIHDLNKRSVNIYSPQGESLAQFKNDSIADIAMNKEGQFITSYYPSTKWHYQVGIYDKNWEPVASFMKNDVPPENSNLIQIKTIKQYNGNPYISISDTLFQISTEGVSPRLILDKGSLRLPDEVAWDMRRNNEREKYIAGDYGYWAGDFYVLFFIYNRAVYYDLWSTSSSKLLYRNRITSPEEAMGIPFNLDGKIIYAWPEYVQENSIYCILDPNQALIIDPHYNESNNPLILEITV